MACAAPFFVAYHDLEQLSASRFRGFWHLFVVLGMFPVSEAKAITQVVKFLQVSHRYAKFGPFQCPSNPSYRPFAQPLVPAMAYSQPFPLAQPLQKAQQPTFGPDLAVRLICPDCRDPNPNIIEEFSSGDLVCGSCGLVLGDRVVDTRSEWRVSSLV